jgi:glycosyltransferase involved in cell wall biosynthesis
MWRTVGETKYDVDVRTPNTTHDVLILTEHVNATYFISFDYALRSLHADGIVSFVALAQETAKRYLGKYKARYWIARLIDEVHPSLVIFSRYAHPAGNELIDYCKEVGIPVIYHIDDNLLDIPDSLPSEVKARHWTQDIPEARRYLIQQSDILYVSTEYLANAMRRHFPKKGIFHGIYAPYLESLIHKNKARRPWGSKNDVKIGYMGSIGHREDLELAVPAIRAILEQYPHISFETFGTIGMPDVLRVFAGRVRSYKGRREYADFLQFLYELDWDIGIAPLADNEFNRCKAPTKFIEYTSCAIPTIASDVLVYNRIVDNKNGFLVRSESEWYEKLQTLMNYPELRSNFLTEARKTCSSRMNLDILKEQLLRLFALVC